MGEEVRFRFRFRFGGVGARCMMVAVQAGLEEGKLAEQVDECHSD